MAKQVATNVVVKVAGIDLSSYVSNVSLSSSADAIEVTSFSSAGARERVSGLKDNSVTIDFMQDYAASAVEATVYPLIGSTAVTFEILPNGTAVSSTNPKYTGSLIVVDWTPVAGAVGELLTASVTWPITGAITKATA
jgi:predicted secreted protein